MAIHPPQPPDQSILKYKTVSESLAVSYGSNSDSISGSSSSSHLSFDTVDIYIFRQIVSHNPAVRVAPAVQLDWKPVDSYSNIPLDEVEAIREQQHSAEEKQIYPIDVQRTSSATRRRILRENGFSADEIGNAVKEAVAGSNNRKTTVENLKNEKWEERMENLRDVLKCKREEALLLYYPETKTPSSAPTFSGSPANGTNKEEEEETAPSHVHESVSHSHCPIKQCIFSNPAPCPGCCKRALDDGEKTYAKMYKCKGCPCDKWKRRWKARFQPLSTVEETPPPSEELMEA